MGLCFLGGALGVIGGLISALTVTFGIIWFRRKNWPAVAGVVRRAEILTRRNPIGPGVVAKEYRPSLVYEYEVSGRKYVGRKLKPYEGRLWTRKRSEAELWLAHPGKVVRVRISPGNPRKAILDPSISPREMDLLAVVGIAGLLVAGVGYWVVLMSCESAPVL